MKSTNNNWYQESGQSLVEILFVLPLFFMVLFGFIFLFQNQMRVFSDEMAQSALLISEAHFDKEEKQIALWESAQQDSVTLIKKQADIAFNPSSYFKNSVDMNNGVFLDKKRIKNSSEISSCFLEPQYQVFLEDNGRFKLSTCASQSAYESLDGKFDPSFKPTPQSYKGQALYYPQSDYSWPERRLAAVNAAVSFSSSVSGVLFSKKQASLIVPDIGNFNKNCLMEPFLPNCSLEAPEKFFSRSAKDSSKLQISFCYTEAAASCLPTGPGIPACLVAKLSQLVAALGMGVESIVCPITNRTIKASRLGTENLMLTKSLIIYEDEFVKRGEILTNIPAFKKN